MKLIALDWSKNVGPFMGVTQDETITLDGRKFRIVLYAAYNALGLIGPEKNGIAVLNEDAKDVVLDEEACIGSGYYGPSKAQKVRFNEIVAMGWPTFRSWVNSHPKRRYDLSGD